MMSRSLWQTADLPVELTFHDPERRRTDDEIPHREKFVNCDDPRLLGEVLLRGLKEA